ncbi:MAG TPA: exodeoxyribonuclease I [Xanthomonadaceae bacterium]|nr:exodeoxyribonuclease I [Xanthomonadaceae bacterium]
MSFYWYDLETFGSDSRRTRIAQFAGLRTDDDMDPIGEPLVLYCKPTDDLLPSPEATLITGITPQQALRNGLNEAELIGHVLDEFAVPQTCAVGYNSLRFDDEFIRCTLYRNFHDPYEREWRGGNSRWDLLDMMRLAHALRPDGIEWPLRINGTAPSFKLTDLSAANGIDHEHAHDALSDVQALIGLARKLKQAQPRLFDYYLGMRDKRRAAALLDVGNMTPVLHVSGKYSAARGSAALVAPICRHPQIDNRVIVFDLDADPEALLALDPDGIADRLYTPTADLPEGESRIPLKEIHLNRCPALVAFDHLRADDFTRLRIDPDLAHRRVETLRAADGLAAKVRQVYARSREACVVDADAALYEGFVPDHDKRLFQRVRAAAPSALPAFAAQFEDPRLQELVFRYQARNWPGSLDAAQQARWDAYRHARLDSDIGLSEYSFETYNGSIASLRHAHADDGRVQALLDALQDWGNAIEASLPSD